VASLPHLEPRHYRRRERHSSPRTQRGSQPKASTSSRNVIETAEVSPVGVRLSRAWSGYSQSEASISSPGGIMDEDDYSSSDTEVGDGTGILDTPFTAGDIIRDDIFDTNILQPHGTHVRADRSSFSKQGSSFNYHNDHDLRACSVSTSVNQDMHKDHSGGDDHVPSGFTLRGRLGDAIAGVTRNRS
jgi:hypothetical protein